METLTAIYVLGMLPAFCFGIWQQIEYDRGSPQCYRGSAFGNGLFAAAVWPFSLLVIVLALVFGRGET